MARDGFEDLFTEAELTDVRFYAPGETEIVSRMRTVTDQPGLRENIYAGVAKDMHDRSLTPADALGVLLTRVSAYTHGAPPMVVGLVSNTVQHWIRALFWTEPGFERAVGKLYAEVLMSTVAMQHLNGNHDH